MALSADTLWSQVSEYLNETTGLHFSEKRLPDLQRGLTRGAKVLGFEGPAACAEWLLATRPRNAQFQALIEELTIGETYFFREKKTFDALTGVILPDLIRTRRSSSKRLRFWSVACSTGEEPYTLAILLQRVLPDLADWDVQILATDLNTRSLRKAVAGEYGPWSFRDCPPEFKRSYFRQIGDRHFAVITELKKLITFKSLNLAEDNYPSMINGTDAMDVILCRNVLMYFDAGLIRRVVGKLYRSLNEGGWLAVGPSEVSQDLFAQFATRNFPGAILYQKDRDHRPSVPSAWSAPAEPVAPEAVPFTWNLPEPLPALEVEDEVIEEVKSTPLAAAAAFFRQERFGEAEKALMEGSDEDRNSPEASSILARSLANLGKLGEALVWCDRWLVLDKMDAGAHYLRAVILTEQDASALAREALQRAVYLVPEFILAHFSLGDLARRQGRNEEAGRHFANALRLLKKCPADAPLPESDGLTAGRLVEIIASMTASGSSV